MAEFALEKFEKYFKIKCPGNLDENTAKDFSDQSKAWMISPVEHFVIDYSTVESIGREYYQALIYLKTTLKKDHKMIYAINLSPTLLKQIKKDGVEQAFNPLKSVEDLVTDKPAGNSSIDVAFINPFLAATQKTLEVQCKIKVQAQRPYLKKAQMPNIAIAGVLSLASKGFSGSIVLCFSQSVFLKIYESMFGEKHDKITPELEDAAAELLNIIYGMAKTELNQKGYDFQKAFPTVLTGEKINIRQTGSKPAVVIPYETNVGSIHIEIEFSQT